MTLSIHHLTKSFDGVKALDDATISFAPGTITAIVGPNGAGKTTLFNVMTGYVKPDCGTMTLGKHDLTHLPPYSIANLGVGRLFQEVRAFKSLTALENLLVATAPANRLFPAWFDGHHRTPTEERSIAICDPIDVLTKIRLEGDRNTPAASLSYGQQKLLAFGRLLVRRSTVLLLDEPFAGLHSSIHGFLTDLMRQLADEGRVIVFIQHRGAEEQALPTHIVEMADGRITASSPTGGQIVLGLQ